MFLPCVDSRGALIGFVGSSMLTGWMAVGNFVYRTNRANFSALPPPNSTAGCPASWLEDDNDQLTSSMQEPLTYLESGHLDLYDVSSIWFSAIGVAFVLILAFLSSCILPSKKSESVDKELLSPLITPFLPSSSASSSTSSSSFFCCTSTTSSPSSPFLPSLSIGSKSTNTFLSKSKMLSSTTNIKEGENEENAKKEELEEMVERNVNKVEFV